MLLMRAVTKDEAGVPLFETIYTHDSLGRLLTSEWINPGQTAGIVTTRTYDQHNRVALSFATKPPNELLYAQVSTHDAEGRLVSRTNYDEQGRQIGRTDYHWSDDGEGFVQGYDKDSTLHGRFRLVPALGGLYGIEDASSDHLDSTPGPSSVRHFYDGPTLSSTVILFPIGQNVTERTITYHRTADLLDQMIIVDTPSGRCTTVELTWTQGQSVSNTEIEFLMDHLQL